jgi:hypothetical protein
VLEESALVTSEKIGRVRTCRLEERGLKVAEKWISERRSLWERRFDRLGDLLQEEDESAASPKVQRKQAKGKP